MHLEVFENNVHTKFSKFCVFSDIKKQMQDRPRFPHVTNMVQKVFHFMLLNIFPFNKKNYKIN